MHRRSSPVTSLLLILSVMFAAASPSHAQTTYKPDAGPYSVEVLYEMWRDAARSLDPLGIAPDGAAGRKIHVRVYIPKLVASVVTPGPTPGTTATFPVVVFSHGMGGTRDGYEYFGRHLASHGYLVIHPQHPGSDNDAVLKAGKEKFLAGEKEAKNKDDAKKPDNGTARERWASLLLEITDENTADPANLENRPRDITFLLDKLATHPRLSKVADTNHVAAAGHSFGSYTTMAICGMTVDLPDRPDTSFRDARVKVGIAMSPQGAGVMGVNAGAWDGIAVPMLLATGTKDMGQGGRAAQWRHEPFKQLALADTCFLNITDANHMTFSGGSIRDRFGTTRKEHVSIVKQTCTAFLDAYLLEDAAAKKWLLEKKIEAASDNGCELTYKIAPVTKIGK